ncbi:hypothetical protein TWF192_003069 [Orbilia oligospora]|uniref:C2H2-type domain-containing protein n=1 Tax=Orbilia oligospora TaxID=2813651 RepID=A0A6G1LSG4_ORBOL|nr:hypothetical protein TWF679_003455 [Orbilia oligospora]KAF3232596.1 hypothetical protein TWF192_003069 [Orbilia oligospora]
MYRHNDQETSRKHGQPESTERISDYYYNNSDCMTSWILDSPNRYDSHSVENPWSSQSGHVSNEYNSANAEIQQYFPTGYQDVPQSYSLSLDTYTHEEAPGKLDFDEPELQSPYVILLDGSELKNKQGKIVSTPWIYLWKTEAVDIDTDQVTSLAPSKDVNLERARYVRHPEMQAAKAFYNALQIMRRIIQANETKLSPYLRTHHERTNCEVEMLGSFKEYEFHAEGCPSCCSALVNLKHKTSLCELGMGLAEKVFLAIDWYATATFGEYESVVLEVSERSVRSLLLAFTQDESPPLFKPQLSSASSLSETAPLQTLAVQSLGVIGSVLGVSNKKFIDNTTIPKRKQSFERVPSNFRHAGYRFFSGQSRPTELLTVNTEPAAVSKLEEYLNSPSRRRILRSQIGQEGMRSIRRLYNVSLYGYNTLERAFNDGFINTYDFSLDFPNHADLLSLGVQTFIGLSNEKASYPTALREVYSILHLCDSINQILPQERYERRKQIEAFFRELEDWRNIIEAAWERSAFEVIVKIRWPSNDMASWALSSSPNPKRVKLSPKKDAGVGCSQAIEASLSKNMDAASKPAACHLPEDRGPMMKALLWMQLIAGVVFTTIAAYFTLNHRTVNALVLYLTGDGEDTLGSTRTLDNTTALLPKNAAWISSSSIMFIDKVKRHIIEKLRSSEFNIFSQAVDVAMDSLSCGWISTINSLELLLVRLAKLVECTKSEFHTFVQQVLYLCTVCAANMTGSESFRIGSKKRSALYSSAYRNHRAEEEMQSWIADEDEIPTQLPTLTPNPKSKSKLKTPSEGLGPLSPATASLASSRSVRARIQSDFLDETFMSPEDRLVSDTASYFPIENSDQDLSGGPITAYTSIINAPSLDPVLTLENQDNILALSQSHYGTPVSKTYSQPSHAHYHTGNNFDSFWALNRHGHPLVVSSLPEHAGYYLAPSSGWNLAEDFLSSANSPSNTYYPPPTSIPTSISTTYAENLKPTIAASIAPTNQGMHRLANPFLSTLAGSPISPYTNPEETPRFLPTAPTPPPQVPPPKPRKRRRSSPLKEEGNNTSGAAGAPPPKRQKKTMLFKCPICKHDIAAPRMNLTRHIKSVHADSRQRRIECEWPGCATTFQAARKDNYRAHLRKHQEKLGEAGN